MDITRRCDYACRILRSAYQSGESYVSVSEVSEKEDIPYAFARSIQHDLVKSGLIKTVRGAHGGLMLGCDPAETTMLEVLQAIQGPVSVASCVGDESFCERSAGCAFNKVWCGADHLLNEYFSKITLEDLFAQGAAHPAIKEAMTFELKSCTGGAHPAGKKGAGSKKASSADSQAKK